MGGSATTSDMADAVVDVLRRARVETNMDRGLTVQGTTPGHGERYWATLFFDRNACLASVSIKSERSERTYTVADVREILDFVRQQESPLALWEHSRAPVTLERFLRKRELPVMSGCLADLLHRMGLADVQKGPPVSISARGS